MSANLSDIAFSVIIKNDGIDDIVFKTIMLKGEKGNSVARVEKTSTSGLVDTYTIYMTDGTAGGTFTVTNGNDINIDDTAVSYSKTWSSQKIKTELDALESETSDAIDALSDMIPKTGTIENQAIASFSDGADDVPLSELTVDIEAWQEGSGDASPSNVRAIHGWNKCNINKANTNLWDEQWEFVNSKVTSKNYIPVVHNTVYFFGNSKLYDVEMFDALKNSLGNPTYTSVTGGFLFTTANNCAFIKFSVANSYGTTYNNDISINYPADDTSYHAHDGGVDTIEFGQTVYGGQLDVTRGKLTVTHGYTNLSLTPDSQVRNYAYNGMNGIYFYNVLPEVLQEAIGLSNRSNKVGHHYDNNSMWVGVSDKNVYWIGVLDELSMSLEDFKTWLTNNQVEVCYELATPFDIDLTPTEVRTLLNANNIYADTGNVEKIVYFKTGSEAVAKMIEAYMRASE